MTVTFPDRGRWVVEAELIDGGAARQNQDGDTGSGGAVGTVDANSTASPNGLAVTPARPHAQWFVDRHRDVNDTDDSGDGGAVQIIEWDLDENTGNGVGGFEVACTARTTGLDARRSDQTKTINTTGKSRRATTRPRARDRQRRDQRRGHHSPADQTASTTYRVDSPPSAAAPTDDDRRARRRRTSPSPALTPTATRSPTA